MVEGNQASRRSSSRLSPNRVQTNEKTLIKGWDEENHDIKLSKQNNRSVQKIVEKSFMARSKDSRNLYRNTN